MAKQTRVKERITVKMAKEFLASRKENQRNVGDRHVLELSDAILHGRWVYNGESIKFDDAGHMIDGQHRCFAAIRAGKSFWSDIVYGLPAESYYTIDQKSKRRGAGDVLRIDGEQNVAALASALAWNIAYRNCVITSSGKRVRISPDSQQISAELRHHPLMRDSYKCASRCRHLTGSGPLMFLHYLFSQIDAELANSFFHSLATGEDLASGHPVLYIRKALLADKVQNKAKMPIGEKMAYIIKGWNLSRRERRATSINSIQWRSGGNNPEPFPVAI